MTVPVPAGAGGVDPSWCMRDCGCTLERGHDGECDLTGPLPEPGCRCDHCLADAAGVEVEGEISRLRAALAAAEQRADTLAAAIIREIDAEWLVTQRTEGLDSDHDERLTGCLSGLSAARRIVQRAFSAALSSRPVQPEENER